MAIQTIDHNTLSELVQAGAVRGAHVVGKDGGWALAARYGLTERYLAATRSKQIRMFKRLETVVAYLREIGISHFDVDAADYDPHSVERTTRPDRSEALKDAHKAAAYDRWFREQVQESLDDPRPNVSHAAAQIAMNDKKAAVRKRLARAGVKS
ncbi:antitoxin PaaA2 family protein [Caballeronia sordidicola]|uniref:Prevent host death protein, Phd antitoxin n=1 Tax=Caballeronia sordidicola TaxID=196367 RepID=A0A242MLH9_CABSO|nr:hypothetical protein [Caballeronia sordidicola]OTP72178.1 Prevent host death protein, Phd antitoxin [Caballeronia sordidicola]